MTVINDKHISSSCVQIVRGWPIRACSNINFTSQVTHGMGMGSFSCFLHFYHLRCVHTACACKHVHDTLPTQRSEDNLQELGLAFHLVLGQGLSCFCQFIAHSRPAGLWASHLTAGTLDYRCGLSCGLQGSELRLSGLHFYSLNHFLGPLLGFLNVS